MSEPTDRPPADDAEPLPALDDDGDDPPSEEWDETKGGEPS